MRIQVKIVGTLKALKEGPRVEILDLPQGTSAAAVIEQLKIQEWEIGFIQVNGKLGSRESILKENDELTLIAPLVGG